MVDFLDGEVELVFVTIVGAAVFDAAVGEDPRQRHAVLRAYRGVIGPGFRYFNFGFRCARVHES